MLLVVWYGDVYYSVIVKINEFELKKKIYIYLYIYIYIPLLLKIQTIIQMNKFGGEKKRKEKTFFVLIMATKG